MKLLEYINTKKLFHFFTAIWVFIIIVDPTNTLFRLKEISFLLFIVSGILDKPTINKYAAIGIILLYFILTLTYFEGIIFGEDFLHNKSFEMYKTFIMFFAFIFIDRINLFRAMIIPSIVISLITITIFILIVISPSLRVTIFDYFTPQNEDIPSKIIVSQRIILGKFIYCVYYRTSAMLVLPLAISWFRALHSHRYKILYFLLTSTFFITLLMSGTRANMLAAFLIIAGITLNYMWMSYFWRPLVLPLSITGLFLVSCIIGLLFSDSGEQSLVIKTSHLVSYINLFIDKPYLLLIGQGPGGLFNTIAYGQTYLTEWTYIEILRNYGLFGGGILLSIYFLPLYLAWQRRKSTSEMFPFSLSYLAYLFIGGTNPLLLSSTGILMLAIAYSFILKQPQFSHSIAKTNL